jgi:hypothetical protein
MKLDRYIYKPGGRKIPVFRRRRFDRDVVLRMDQRKRASLQGFQGKNSAPGTAACKRKNTLLTLRFFKLKQQNQRYKKPGKAGGDKGKDNG